ERQRDRYGGGAQHALEDAAAIKGLEREHWWTSCLLPGSKLGFGCVQRSGLRGGGAIESVAGGDVTEQVGELVAAGLEIGGKRLGDPGGFGLGRLVTGAEFIDAVDDAGRGRRIVVDRLAETNDVRELHGVQLTAAIDRRPVLGRAEAAD